MQLQGAVKWPFLYGCSVWMRPNPVCKCSLSQWGGLMRRHYAGVLSWAALSPWPATRCSREARIRSTTVPWSTVVLCMYSLHRSSCFEERDPQCRLSLSWNVRSFHMDQKKGAWLVFRLHQFRNRMELISYSALHVRSESCSPTEQSRLLISIILVHAYSYCSEKRKRFCCWGLLLQLKI